MTVEVGHLKKDAIEIKLKYGYSTNPKSKAFEATYTPLMNRAVEFRLKYRNEHNQQITPNLFTPLDNYKLPYNDYNKEQRKLLDKKNK